MGLSKKASIFIAARSAGVRGRKSRPSWRDALVGCAVAASLQGVVVPGTDAKLPPRPRVRLSELQRSKR